MKGALAQRAESTFTGLAEEVQRELPAIFRQLVTIGTISDETPTRQRTPLARFAGSPPPDSWAELTAQRERLGTQYQSLMAAGKADEAMAVAERLIGADRRLIKSTAADAAQKSLQQACREELCDKLDWLATQYRNRQEWSAAGERQQELADFCKALWIH